MIAIDSAAARGSGRSDVVLDARVEALGVLAHEHDVHVLEAAAGHDRARRAHVRVQIERAGAARR